MASHRTPVPARILPTTLIALAATFGLGGCDFFTEPGSDTATVEIESDRPTSIRIITSNNFAVGLDDEANHVFHLFQGDTTWVQLPFRQDFDLRATAMFYVRAAESEDADAVISLRALIDGQQRFTHTAVLEGAGIQFYYVGF
jgi:hypothetical protein